MNLERPKQCLMTLDSVKGHFLAFMTIIKGKGSKSDELSFLFRTWAYACEHLGGLLSGNQFSAGIEHPDHLARAT